jgi:hypothetical protein
MNSFQLMAAGLDLGYDISLTIEADSSMWTGTDDNRVYLTETEIKALRKKATDLENEKTAARNAVLAKLGLTADEVTALLS